MYSYNEKTGEFEVTSGKTSFSFKTEELQAISKVAAMMIKADGETKAIEVQTLETELSQFAPGTTRVHAIVKLGIEMDSKKCYELIKNMNANQKRYVSCFLMTLMFIDEDIDEMEKLTLALLVKLCDLPLFPLAEAIDYMVELRK